MNYRHAFHAGNFADVFKHALLALVLDYLKRKETGFRYIDTHAGPALYDLSGSEAARTGEWIDGIGRIVKEPFAPDISAFLAPYLQALGDNAAQTYAGSPALAQRLLRKQDRLTCCELHPEDFRALERNMGRDNRLTLREENGYRALKGLVPPPERRGLVLIDPPFEERNEFQAMEEALAMAWRKWPTGIYALWYPVKDVRAVAQFVARLRAREIPRIIRFELAVEAVRNEGPLSATGLIVVNPPYTLEEQARRLLPVLAKVMARGAGAQALVEIISDETLA
jgi:23S rRNA (adenine2030-N6)-methyltransferase